MTRQENILVLLSVNSLPEGKGRVFRRHIFVWSSVLALAVSSIYPQTQKSRSVFLTYNEAKPVVEALDEVLPAELKGKDASAIAPAWATWIKRRDAEIRSRLDQGDEDSLINFLLFGASFTKQPRVTFEQLRQMKTKAEGEVLATLIASRSSDLVAGATNPGSNERLLFARKILSERKGFHLETSKGREEAKTYLVGSLQRILNEDTNYAKTLEAARMQGDASAEFAERSQLFRARGLSSDTSILPNYAIEESLKQIKTRDLIKPGSVRRVAVVGPGLDFTDKQEGYDLYPQQTIQPFAIIDTLLRTGLASAGSLQIVTFDLSPRVNDHLMQSRQHAQKGEAYVVQLPRDLTTNWKPGAVKYWEQFGDQIGQPVPPVAVPLNISGVKLRAVRVRPNIVSRITPADLNIVLQAPDLAAGEVFDLVIATNILVYYDTFEQSLALLNIEKMLRPGGFLLSNNALLELPSSKMHSTDYLTVVYSDRAGDGDHIVWYQRSP